jgi:phage shock protein A
MALITRMTRLFRADLHAVLDRIEEPDLLLRQSVREMEEALGRDRQRLKLLQHEREEIRNRQTQLSERLAQLEEELDVCFRAGNETLARPLIRRKLEHQRYAEQLERRGTTLDKTLETLRSQADENQDRLQAMRQKMELLAGESREPDEPHGWEMPDYGVRDDEVEVALLRERERRAQS